MSTAANIQEHATTSPHRLELSRRCVRQTSSLAVAKAAADDRPFFGVLWADLVEKRINVRRSLANHDELNRDQPTESENCYNGLEPDVVP
ncbi:hypothetical protein CSPX01_08721 [Colletotrichum filicis]|nr:hypothetical protein CSPX01_08721 [Colletotrichum filicis]